MDASPAFVLQVTLAGDSSVEGAHIQTLLTFHAGPVVGITTSPYCHTAVTAGADGTVRLFDYRYVHQSFVADTVYCSAACPLSSDNADLNSAAVHLRKTIYHLGLDLGLAANQRHHCITSLSLLLLHCTFCCLKDQAKVAPAGC